MEVVDRQNMGGAATQAAADSRIHIPAPSNVSRVQKYDDAMAKGFAEYGVVPLGPSRYLKEIATGVVHKWSEDMGKRSDLMTNYEPSLVELVKFGETVYDLMTFGFTPQEIWDAGATSYAMSLANLDLEDLLKIGVPPEDLKEMGYNVEITPAANPVQVAVPRAPEPIKAPATAVQVAPPPPPPPPPPTPGVGG